MESHNRAYGNTQEYKKQLFENDYFPKIKLKIANLVKHDGIHRIHIPTPEFIGQLIKIDFYSTKKHFSIDGHR